MPEALRSFLVSVGIIVVAVLIIPLVESLVKLLRRGAQARNSAAQPAESERAKAYSRELA